jgi:hypothetical protein
MQIHRDTDANLRVVARLCTIIHVLLHQPSSSSYSLSSSFSFSPFTPYAFCVVSIDTTVRRSQQSADKHLARDGEIYVEM